MNINLEIVTLEEKEKLKKLLQLYLHDLSLYFPLPFNSITCEYDYNIDKYFSDNYAYFIKDNNNMLDLNNERYDNNLKQASNLLEI